MNNSEFTVTVRNTEPLLKKVGKSRSSRFDVILFNLAAALVLEAAIVLFLMMAGIRSYILYTAPAPIILFVLSLIEGKLSSKTRYIIIGILTAVTIAAGIILRKYTFNGYELIMNQLYDFGEAAQAYIYDRFNVGETGMSSPDTCMKMAIAVISALLGLLASIPRERLRVGTCVAIFVAITLTIAYFGLLPAIAGVAMIICAMILLMSRGRIVSALPLLIVVGVIFAVIIAVNPGESYSISRVDENLRDRIALGSAQLENDDVYNQNQEFNFGENQNQDNREEDESFFKSDNFMKYKTLWISLMILLPVLIIVILGILMHRRLQRKRLEVRAGLDSSDPKKAITAMFPYAMRWLKSYGVAIEDIPGITFSELLDMVKVETPPEYAEDFEKMNSLWKKAAYSEHDVSEEDRIEMNMFMNDTIKMVKDKADFKEKLKIRFKYAL